MTLRTLLTTLFLFSCFTLFAQSSQIAGERNGVQRTHKQKMKRMDVFNPRTFKPFFYAEANYGLNGTFSKDKVFTVSPPLSIGIGYRFSPKFSAGLRAGQSIYTSEVYYYDRAYKTNVKTRFQMASAVANVHLPVGTRGEVYGGLGLGYQNTSLQAMEESQLPKDADRRIVRPQTGLFATGQVGARYTLSPTVAMQAEIGTGLSTLSVGLRYRLR